MAAPRRNVPGRWRPILNFLTYILDTPCFLLWQGAADSNALRIPPGRSVRYVGWYFLIRVPGNAKIHAEKVRLKVPQCVWYFLWGLWLGLGCRRGPWGGLGGVHGDTCDVWNHQNT